MRGTLRIVDIYCDNMPVGVRPGEPGFDGWLRFLFENCRNRADGRYWTCAHFHLCPNHCHQICYALRLNEYLICLSQYCRGCPFHFGMRAENDRDRLGVRVTHGADYGKAVSLVGHVQIAHQHIEDVRPNQLQSFSDVCRGANFKAAVLKDEAEGFAKPSSSSTRSSLVGFVFGMDRLPGPRSTPPVAAARTAKALAAASTKITAAAQPIHKQAAREPERRRSPAKRNTPRRRARKMKRRRLLISRHLKISSVLLPSQGDKHSYNCL